MILEFSSTTTFDMHINKLHNHPHFPDTFCFLFPPGGGGMGMAMLVGLRSLVVYLTAQKIWILLGVISGWEGTH